MNKETTRDGLTMANRVLLGAMFVLLTACAYFGKTEPVGEQKAAPPPAATAPAAPPAPPAAPPAPPPPPAPVAFEQAVENAATALFAAAEKVPNIAPAPPRPVIIDPLVDGNNAQRTVASEAMGQRIAGVIGTKFTRFAVQPFERQSLDRDPLLLIGTLTAINAANDPKARNDIYRICLALIDVRAGKVVAKGVARATEQTVDATPTPYYRDSPAWVKDKTSDGYIKSCQGSKAGDAADLLYLETLPTAMAVSDAIRAYEARDYTNANRLYRTALALPGGEQKRVINGLYLTSWKLRKTSDAGDAFGKIVVRGIEDKRLGIMFLFKPNTSDFVADNDLRAQYELWLKVLAQRAADAQSCLNVVGNTSKTGTDAVNDALSLRRAEFIRNRLERQSPVLRNYLKAQGVGSRETIVGLGTDDARDAMDRRVEFKVASCGSA